MNVQGVGDAVPFAAIFAVIVIRGRALPLRSFVTERLPRVSAGQVAWYKVVGWTLVVYALVVWFLPLSWVSAVTSTITGAIVLESIVVITGFAGQISLAQWAIAGLGALITAHLIVIGVPKL